MAEHTVRLFAHTTHEHALTSTQICAKLLRVQYSRLISHFFDTVWKAVAAGAEV